MEIAVLLKQVPSTESLVEIADDGVSIKTGDVKWVMNPYDELAVEEALRIKEAKGGTVTVASVGADKTVEAIRTALAMGADKGLLINDPAAAAPDALGVARILAGALKTISFDLVIAGQRAVDQDNYQVAPAVAEFLNLPHVSMVNKMELLDGKVRCSRTVEGGAVVLEAPLPALVTTQRGLNEPRYASLPGIMKAKRKPLDQKTLADIGVDASAVDKPLTRVVALNAPPQRQGGRIIEGETDQEKAAALVKVLKDEAKVI
ncbi:MAG: electron transfer flavoprotein subunit beta/FixA family protein [Desulfobacterales bacterium]|nr:electron transfer flavoprotein subunit beta/FixA family protein [Desulfobacterales bacterium]